VLVAALLGGCRAPQFDFDPAQLWRSPSMKDPEVSQEQRGDIVASVAPGVVVGQTFTARRPRLNGIELWLGLGADADPASGVLRVELYHSPSETVPLATVPLAFQTIADNSSIWISLPHQNDPAGQPYFLALKSANGSVHVMGRLEDAYAGGELWINASPQNSDLSFRTSYPYDFHAVCDDLRAWSGSLWLVLPLLAALWLPGALAMEILFPKRIFDWGERIAISVGLSLAILPLLMLWTSVLGLRWSRPAVLLASILTGALYLWRLRQRGASLKWLKKIDGASLALAAVFLFGLGLRLAMTRDLAAPAWVDAVHHGTLTRLILEQGRLPESYAPYIEVEHANYHFGFHVGLATFQMLSGLELHTGMLIYGQVLNALSIFSAYLLTVTFTRSRAAGVAAALLTGAFFPMPAYYASWGRYTQLAGQVILPAAAALSIRAWPPVDTVHTASENRRSRLVWIVAAGLACAGLLLVHYRVAAFLVVLLMAHWILYSEHALWQGATRRTIGPSTGTLAAIGGWAVLLTLPWWPETISQLLLPFSNGLASGGGRPSFFTGFAWNLLTAAYGRQVMVLAALGLALAILLRRWFWLTMVLWVAGMFLLANMSPLGLPGLNFVNNLAVEIALYLPITLLGGFLIGWVSSAVAPRLPARWRTAYWSAVALVLGFLALYGARALLPILNPVTLLFRLADEPAIAWIDRNLPAGEPVIINPFLWGYGIYAGGDGGAWITPLAGRATLPPPVLYGMANEPQKVKAITGPTRQVLDFSRDPQALHALLEEQDIEYIYIGARGGALSPQALRYSPLFQLLYSEGGAWVFQAR
jgi:hypothetical protein